MVDKQITFPTSFSELTNDWLSQISISHFPSKIISFSEGDKIAEGFTGEVVRIIPKYETEKEENPQTLIIKFATSNPGINQLLTNTKGYLKEIELYKVLYKYEDFLHVPKVYYSAINKENSKYIMILEDLSNRKMEKGNQVKPIDFAFSCRIVDYFAKLHSIFWDKPEVFQNLQWIKDYSFVDYLRDLTIKMFETRKENFLKRNEQRLEQKTIDIIKTMDIKELYEKTSGHRKSNVTLLHGDTQPTNLLYNEKEMAMIDWQYSSFGVGCKDLIIFLGIWINETTLTREEVKGIKDRYYNKLIENGVSDYKREIFEEDWSNLLKITLANIASVSTEENIGDDQEKKKRYQEYLDCAEKRFICFYQNNS